MAKNNPIFTGKLKNSPVGDLWVAITEVGLVLVEWSQLEADFNAFLVKRFNRPIQFSLDKAVPALQQLDEYLHGRRRRFSIPIDWTHMRPFQKKVLQITFSIPYGQTRTYSQIAQEIGNPRAARAVGRAQATNPMPLIIPCHRVIGVDGKLHGYGGGEGLPTKEWLLRLEGAVLT